MSRSLTAAQVIGLGEYLNSSFDPASLTVSQLLGVLGFHNIQYPTPYTKPKLVQLFRDEITSKATKLRRERVKKERSFASDDGITDGVTGRPIGESKPPVARRSSRRLSRVNSDDDEIVEQPAPPKRRRASAQPVLGGGASRKIVPTQPVLVEESEPEEDDEVIVRKVGRSKKTSTAAGTRARRISVADDSGWEDNNIFQSGAESSSPARPSPPKPKVLRKSLAPRKSRKSMSAPPPSSPSSSPPKATQFSERIKESHKSPTFKFEPSLPPDYSRPTRVSTRTTRSSVIPPIHFSPAPTHAKDEDSADELDIIRADKSAHDAVAITAGNDSYDEEEVAVDEEDVEEDQNAAVSRRLAAGGKVAVKSSAQSTSWILRIFYVLFALAGSTGVYNYKAESASIGYCDTGKNTNRALDALNEKWAAIEACNSENRTFLQLPSSLAGSGQKTNEDPILCPPPALIPFLHPSRCTPCPEHASCAKDVVTCENGFLLHAHPLVNLLSPFGTATPTATQKLIGDVANGFPGLGPVAFPQRCVEDPQRKRNIGALGKAVEALLGQERGARVCAGNKIKVSDGGEARNWGMEMGELREAMKMKTPPSMHAAFDDTFDEAIQQLVQWGGVILGEDSAGKRYLAHKTPNLTLSCAAIVKSRDIWENWYKQFIAIATVIGLGFVSSVRRASRAVENKRVAELVQIALDTLRNQELAHHTDPISAPQAYLSSLQLRDLVLQDEHSISSRRRLWDQVERVVEGNANVRANLEEVHGGEELRVWRWVGGAGWSPRKPVSPQAGEDERVFG